MLRKITDSKGLKTYQKKYYDGVLSVKLQVYSDQTGTLLQRQLATGCFWNMYSKLAVLKRIF